MGRSVGVTPNGEASYVTAPSGASILDAPALTAVSNSPLERAAAAPCLTIGEPKITITARGQVIGTIASRHGLSSQAAIGIGKVILPAVRT